MKGMARERSSGPAVHPLLKLLLLQLVISVALGAFFWGITDRVSGYSALLGGLCCVLPNAYLALRLVAPRRDPGARALLSAAYIGEFGKLALTVLMFSLTFALVRPLAPLPLFAGFIACQLATFAGLFMRDQDHHVRTGTKNGE
jgi:ATP synthase protein I